MSLWAPARDQDNPRESASAKSRFRRLNLGLSMRLGILGAAFIVEKIILTALVNHDGAQDAEGFGAARIAQRWGIRFVVALAAAMVVFVLVRDRRGSKPNAGSGEVIPMSLGWTNVHILLIGLLVPLSYLLFRDSVAPVPLAALICSWVALGAAALLAAFAAMAPLPVWIRAARDLGVVWLYAIVIALLSASAMQLSHQLWATTTAWTFDLVRLVLTPILPQLHADVANEVLSTDRFAVLISEYCSGLEGVGLMLAFCGAWLCYFRREYVFPRALVLIPMGVVGIYALNVLRIAALILIGHAGFTGVAVYGFHSQAGWIAFNAAACSMVYWSRRNAWLTVAGTSSTTTANTQNPTAVYLMPLLAVLIAGTLSHVFSSDFEQLYPLRLLAGIGVLAFYRRELATLGWRWSWRAPTVGVLIFGLWMAAAQFLLADAVIPMKLAAMPGMLRGSWIVCRIATAVLIVPIVEELAYRGYLMRRLMSKEFESLPYRSVNWLALSGAAIAFGLPHGVMWLPATAAGFAYGLITKRRGSIGEAIIAHATTNLLVACAVLGGNQWQLW